MAASRGELLGLTADELGALMVDWGEKPYHGRQLYGALYRRRQLDTRSMTELSKSLRRKLASCTITLPRLKKRQRAGDGTDKYLLELTDKAKIECVLIPERKRTTLCISTQAGCPLDCRFCLTAMLGFRRNLNPAEILGQVLYVLADRNLAINSAGDGSRPALTNLVLMGMGEPLLNLDNVLKSLIILADPGGLALSPRRITLSTVGLVPQMRRLARAPVVPNLAVSLSATTDEVRDRLMPINRRYPIDTILQACADYPLKRNQRVTFEYVLMDGVNDSDDDARRLVKLLAHLRSKVNLLPLNPGNANGLRPSSPRRVNRFREILTGKGLPAYVRRPRGMDIYAACGQLHLAADHSSRTTRTSRLDTNS
ncbi:MAG: 23S rRNA (adenine(2503)-C(2))-methyltransferase RlmN [Acidobacteriota bacterium]|nr:23S rRNA (adenine(2503)-C(2))-methyltransferase RlmN [Acidobacteriota bacterium]